MVVDMMHLILGISTIFVLVLDTRNLPMLVHCNSGKVCQVTRMLFIASNWFCSWLHPSSGKLGSRVIA